MMATTKFTPDDTPPFTMASANIKQYGLAYDPEERMFVTPVWAVQPNEETIKYIVSRHIPELGSGVHIRFFNEGSYNKLYQVSATEFESATPITSWLFRVSLPIEPFYKTESEVATLAYVGARTSLPVPKVIAYDSSADNELHFEWILMEKLPGECIARPWSEEMTWDDKVEITKSLAAYTAQLRNSFSSPLIGNLYFTGRERPSSEPTTRTLTPTGGTLSLLCTLMCPIYSILFGAVDPTPSEPGCTVPKNPAYVVGRKLESLLTLEKRLHLPANRGPFSHTIHHLHALLDIQIKRIRSALAEEDGESIFAVYDKSFRHRRYDAEKAIKACGELIGLLPHLFPETEEEGLKRLWHHDMSNANILVALEPETGKWKITGLVDWESVGTMAEWDVPEWPDLLTAALPNGLNEPTDLPKEGEDGWNDVVEDIRQRWELFKLRKVFDEEEARVSGDGEEAARRREHKARMAKYDERSVETYNSGRYYFGEEGMEEWRKEFLEKLSGLDDGEYEFALKWADKMRTKLGIGSATD